MKLFKKQNGITLVALVITIIILLILAGISISSLTDNGLFQKAKDTERQTEIAGIKEKIQLEYIGLQENNVDTKEIFEMLVEKLDFKDATYSIGSKSVVISIGEKYLFTLLEDGTLLDGRLAYLDVADGSIDIKANGYIQGIIEQQNSGAYKITGDLVEYTGKYVITGTSTENVVRIMEKGIYDIIIKDLNIDVSSIDGMTAFNANRGSKETGCYVTITLEGENKLYGGNAPGLGFAKATPNVDGVTNGSTLTIQGEGKLEAIGGHYSAGIGSGYTGWEAAAGIASNITINSGNIIARGGTHGAGIGASLYGKVNNIIINGGNIEAVGNSYGAGIGGNTEGTVDNIIINGGNVKVIGGNLSTGIGSRGFSASGGYLGTIRITGGIIYACTDVSQWSKLHSAIGNGCGSVKIEGGTIRTYAPCAGIFGGANVEITGGNLLLNGLGDIGTLDENKNFVKSTATNGQSDIYLTKIKLTNAKGNEKVTELKTSDNIEYGIKDMYVAVDDENTTDIDETGMIYVYLPKGSRTITIEVDGKTYSGTVETTEEGNVVTLN